MVAREFATGAVFLKIDGKESGHIAVESGKASFRVPAGEHKVELQK